LRPWLISSANWLSTAFGGVIFLVVIDRFSEDYLFFKSVIFGWGVLIRVIITKWFNLPVLAANTPEIAFFFFVGAALFGLTLALAVRLLKRQKISVLR